MKEAEKATDEWNLELARHVRGFKVSDLPMKVVMTFAKEGTSAEFFLTLRIVADYSEVKVGGTPQVRPTMFKIEQDYPLPEGWNYWEYAEKVVPGGTWSPLDMPNPRLYSMDGTQLSNPPEGAMALEVERNFKEALGCLWQIEVGSNASTPVNDRRSRIFELLDHHHSKGGNPASFSDFIGEVARNPAGLPSPPTKGNVLLQSFGAERAPLTDPEGLSLLLEDWMARSATVPGSKKGKQVPSETEKAKPKEPTLESKFQSVPGCWDKWMHLLESEGLVDEAGRFTIASGVRGKGKLIAAWDAAQSVFSLAPFPSGAAMMRALNRHFEGLAFSGRLDRVRFTNDFDAVRDGYKEVLRGN